MHEVLWELSREETLERGLGTLQKGDDMSPVSQRISRMFSDTERGDGRAK